MKTRTRYSFLASPRKTWLLLVACVLVGSLVVGMWLWGLKSGGSHRSSQSGLPESESNGSTISSLKNLRQLYSQYQVSQYLKRSERLLNITIPSSATVGTITDILNLRSKTPSTADVYKEAANGDMIILFDEQLLIYRPSTNQVIYHGPDPKKILDDAELTIQKVVQYQANQAHLLTASPEELPVIRQVADLEGARLADPQFFAEAKFGDVVATFPGNQLEVLFRLGENKVLNLRKISDAPGL